MKVYVLCCTGDPAHEGDFIGVFSSADKIMKYIQDNISMNDPQLVHMTKDKLLSITHISPWTNDRRASDLYAYIREVDEKVDKVS